MIQPEGGAVEGEGASGTASAFCIGPAPESIVLREFNPALPRPAGAATTQLLLDRQLDATASTNYVRSVERLETTEAVQHESQWRLPFDPQTQRVTVHSIRTIRGQVATEHATLERFRFLQREEGLEGQVIDGLHTALLVLEDVQRGDILDVSYSIEARHRLFPDYQGLFFIFYDGTFIGDYCIAVKFDARRPLIWKASNGVAPEESSDAGSVLWTWEGSNFSGPKVEPFTPVSEVPGSWIQISSLSSWSEVISGVLAAWRETPNEQRLLALVSKISYEEETLAGRVNRAIRFVQDELRYLSVNLELGGQTPTACGSVLVRRYGDCKDLSFLLAQLLKGLGIEACPVLVDTKALRTLPDFLPAPNLFNHVVVEFELEGERRWVDATMNRQGGGPLDRAIPDFGFGLPIREGSDQLVPAPASKQDDQYELREEIFLDTTGADSLLVAELKATGAYADSLRRQIDGEGEEQFGETRLSVWKAKYSRAKRSGPVEIEDDLELNEIRLVETVEINDFLGADDLPGNVRFQVKDLVFLECFVAPDDAPRRTAWQLPYPLNILYALEVKSASTNHAAPDRKSIQNEFIEFHRMVSAGQGSWSFSFRTKTRRSFVPANKVEAYRKDLLEIYKNELWYITSPGGVPRPRKRGDIGPVRRNSVPTESREPSGEAVVARPRMLQTARTAVALPARRPAPALQPRPAPGNPPGVQRGQAAAPQVGKEPPKRRRRKRRSRAWIVLLLSALLVIGMIAAVAYRYSRPGAIIE